MTFARYQTPGILCAVIITAMFSLQLSTSLQESQTIDEGVHLSAGLSYWKTGDFRLNPEHPPLIKILAAVPLLFTNVTLPINDIAWQTWDQYQFGKQFLYHNTLTPQTILLLGRIPIMLLSVVLGLFIFQTSRELFGPWGGVLSVTLYALEPGFIAHGHYITTDLGFTLFAFLSLIKLVKLLDHPTRRNAVWFAVVLFITGLTKFSAMVWVGAIFFTLILLKVRERRHPVLQFRRLAKVVLIALPFLALITWSIYGFDIRRRENDPRVTQLYSQRADYLANHPAPTSPLEKFAFSLGDHNNRLGKLVDQTAAWSIPGYAFFRGFITVIGHSVGGQGSYLLGQFGDKGWWYYFPIAFLTKTSIPTLVTYFLLVVVCGGYMDHQRRQKIAWREKYRTIDRRWFVFIAVPTIFFISTLTSHLNLGWRHIMPIYPSLFVLAGVLTTSRVFPKPKWRLFVPLALGLGMVVVQVMTYPNEIGYFNAFARGSKNGPNILLDSNLDWGQELPKLAAFMKQHNLSSIPFVGFGFYDLNAYLKADYLPTNDDIAQGRVPHGFVAIGVGALYSTNPSYTWLKNYPPYKRLGSGIYVYRLP